MVCITVVHIVNSDEHVHAKDTRYWDAQVDTAKLAGG